MKPTFIALLALCLCLSSCSSTPKQTPKESPEEKKPLQKGDKSKAKLGKVMLVDKNLGFVVVDFGPNVKPPVGQKCNVYRGGKHVGEVTTTNQTDESFAVADINNGVIRVGDFLNASEAAAQSNLKELPGHKRTRAVAAQGYAGAQSNLGYMYRRGEGVPKDDKEAVKWTRKAAEQGHARAQYNLGAMYADGRGVEKDFVIAYAWYNIAVASGDAEAKKKKDIFAKEMTPSQISTAQKLSKEMLKKYPRMLK